ncbi:hypothetical protein [Gimesia aquarii]|uniref:Uncharacterized protein n=1 Tax=Gimesia aquarii TaxID=2527964 RepID=A0A517WP54_9PLAN|nr:hypothetical protein [Gimesia aquarii]QDU07040.1 hypothetical protein V202x_03850 [Gimesia aquarii]
MKPIDFAKTIGVAVALLAINVLVAILVMLVYVFFINPGHPNEFYEAAALRISPWCSHIAGTALFLGAGYLFTKRLPGRNGFLFAVTFTVWYAIIDAATVGFLGAMEIEFLLSMTAKLVAALLGVFFARRTIVNAEPTPVN